MICHFIDICPNTTCQLFERPSGYNPKPEQARQKPKIDMKFFVPKEPKRAGDWPWDKVANHKPVWDGDVDLFSRTKFRSYLTISF
jgi:hypothetical protein